MPLLPKEHAARIEFFKTKLVKLAANSTAIGTTSAAVTALSSAVTAASTALTAQGTAQDAAKSATQDLKAAMETMTNLGMTIIEQVRTKSRSAGDGVFALADLPAPATPTHKGAPGTPFEPKASLDVGSGELSLTWKCSNPKGTAGTLYQIYRSETGAAGEMTYLGGTGDKEFTDTTIPAGATSLTYKIQGVRSTAVGPWATFNILFGTNAGGTMTATLVENKPAKNAA